MEPVQEPALMRSILASVGEGIILYDRDLRYRFWNPAMERLTGLGAHQVLGRRAPEVFPYLKAYGIDQLLLRALAGETVHGPDIPYLVPETGRQGWQSGIYRPHQDATGAVIGVVALIRDITERKAAEESLRQYRLLADTTRDIILFIRLRDGRILRANQAALDAYGYTGAEIRDRTIGELRAPDTREALPAQIRTAFTEGLRFETVHQRKDGSRFPVEVGSRGTTLDGEPVLLSIIRDISERKRAAEEWEQTFDTVPDAVAILDEKRQIVRVNRAMAIRLGVPPAACVGRKCYEAIHGLTEPPPWCPHADSCQDGKEHTAEVYEPRFGGHFLVSTTPRFDAQGRLLGAVHISRDISQLKRAEEDRRALALFPEQNPSPVLRLGRDGIVLYANEASRTLLTTWGGAVGAPLLPEARAAIVDRLLAAGATEVEVTCGERVYSLMCVPFEAEGYVNIYGLDITKRKRAEDALAESQHLLHSVLEQAAEGITVRDAQGRVMFVNAVARRRALQRPEGTAIECAPEVWGEYLDADGTPVPLEQWPAARALRGETTSREFLRRTATGSVFVLDSAAPLRSDKGDIIGAVAITTDISERKRMEDRLRDALTHEERALADNVTLLREVHHRTKNNLQMLCDLLYLKAETLPAGEPRALLEDSYGRIYAFARLHEQLYETMQRGEVRLGEYLERLVASVQQFAAGPAIRVEAAPGDHRLDLDRAISAGLIVNELVTNALKHAFPKRQPGAIGVRLVVEGGDYVLDVWDTGQGMPPDVDPDTAQSLGLRLVRLLAHRLQATVTLKSEGGATFTIRFPIQGQG